MSKKNSINRANARRNSVTVESKTLTQTVGISRDSLKLQLLVPPDRLERSAQNQVESPAVTIESLR